MFPGMLSVNSECFCHLIFIVIYLTGWLKSVGQKGRFFLPFWRVFRKFSQKLTMFLEPVLFLSSLLLLASLLLLKSLLLLVCLLLIASLQLLAFLLSLEFLQFLMFSLLLASLLIAGVPTADGILAVASFSADPGIPILLLMVSLCTVHIFLLIN